MANIKNNVTQLIGHTSLVRLSALTEGYPGNVISKVEFLNPMNSLKDRAALSMIETAEMVGKLKPGATVIEATSGNTGIALAFICASRKHPLMITMPEYVSLEENNILKSLGVKVHLTPAKDLMQGAIDKALELHESIEDSFMPMQFDNPANPKAHFENTGPEIWQDTDGEVNVFIAGVGTGGTITGVGQYLKAKKPSAKIIAVEPKNSAVISGGQAGQHKIQGIGAGFIPSILDISVIDEVALVSDEEAVDMCKKVALKEGLLVGLSSGANLHVACELAKKQEYQDKLIVTIIADSGERYLNNLNL